MRLRPTASWLDELFGESVCAVDDLGAVGTGGRHGKPGDADAFELYDRGVPFINRSAVVEQIARREADVEWFRPTDLRGVLRGPRDRRLQLVDRRDLRGT